MTQPDCAMYPHLHMPSSPTHLLLIDDDELSRAVLDLHLSDAGYTLTEAESGDDALTRLRHHPRPDLVAVLSDLQMPGTCGPELARELRPLLRSGTCLVAMSGSHPSPTRLVGYDTFLLKPFTPDQLAFALDALRDTPASLPASPIHPTPSNETAVLDDATFTLLFSFLNPAQQTEMLRLCFSEFHKHLRRMQAAQAVGDLATLRHCAHAIKGSFAMIGARELQSLTGELEIHCPLAPADQQASLLHIDEAAHRLAGMLSTRGFQLDLDALANVPASSGQPSGTSPDSPPDQETS